MQPLGNRRLLVCHQGPKEAATCRPGAYSYVWIWLIITTLVAYRLTILQPPVSRAPGVFDILCGSVQGDAIRIFLQSIRKYESHIWRLFKQSWLGGVYTKYNLWYANIVPRLCRTGNDTSSWNENITLCIANIFLETIRQIAVPRAQWWKRVLA